MITRSNATIKDIAKRLGVSTSTVSRAINGSQDVSNKTKEAVLELAAQMDYQPNTIAQSLKNQRTNIIGVIIPETVNHFFSRAIAGIQEVASTANMNIMVCQSNESQMIEMNNVRTLLNARVDGVIVSVSKETKEYGHFQNLIERKMPIIFFDRIADELEASSVQSDNYDAAFKATKHLIEVGCKRIVRVSGPQNLYNCKWRLKGYRDALESSGMSFDDDMVIYTHYHATDVEQYTNSLLDRYQPDGIFAINDEGAMKMIKVIKSRGLRVPEDVAIVGINNDLYGEYIEPSLTSIEIPAYDMGKAAANMFLESFQKEDLAPQQRIIKSKLIKRQSPIESL